jgi:undecaprenyl-diphosphatase
MGRNTKFTLIIVSLSILASIISIYARVTPRFPGDLWLTLTLQSFYNNCVLSIMEWISFIFGDWLSIIIVVTLSGIVWRCIGWREAILIPISGLITLVNTALKVAINRPRPPADLIHIFSELHSASFPSGHAFFAIMVLGIATHLFLSNLGNRILRIIIPSGLAILILLVGVSRVYLGVHWASDVLGAYIIGGVFLTALIWGYKIWKANRTKAKILVDSNSYQ